MRRTTLFAASVLAVTIGAAACRTARPAGVEGPLQPVAAGADVVSALRERMMDLHSVRSLMRVHVGGSSHVLTFRAQMLVEPQTRRMQLIAYTPLGTEGATIIADGDHAVFLDHIHRTAWEGSAAELAASIGVFDPRVGLADWALDVAGFPASGEFVAGETGLASIKVADMAIVFDPAVFPARNVVVSSAKQKVDITHLELVSTDADVPRPAIPSGYECCVAPKM